MLDAIMPQQIMVDSSIWIDYFNGKVSEQTEQLDNLLNNQLSYEAVIADVILMEVLQGFGQENQFKQAGSALDLLTCFDILSKSKAINYANYYRQLRKKGITIRKSNDVMIAGFCIENNLPLLFADKDFLPFVEHLSLVNAMSHILGDENSYRH